MVGGGCFRRRYLLCRGLCRDLDGLLVRVWFGRWVGLCLPSFTAWWSTRSVASLKGMGVPICTGSGDAVVIVIRAVRSGKMRENFSGIMIRKDGWFDCV